MDRDGHRGGKSVEGLRCSFCGKPQNEVDKLIAGPGVYICNQCVQLCGDIIAKEHGQPWTRHPTPPGETYQLQLLHGDGTGSRLQFPLPIDTVGVHLRVLGHTWSGPCPACGGWTVPSAQRTACFQCGHPLPDPDDAPLTPDPRD